MANQGKTEKKGAPPPRLQATTHFVIPGEGISLSLSDSVLFLVFLIKHGANLERTSSNLERKGRMGIGKRIIKAIKLG